MNFGEDNLFFERASTVELNPLKTWWNEMELKDACNVRMILQIFLSLINIYVLYLKSIHHSYFYAHQFSPVAHTFPSLALYPHGVTKSFVFVVPYANVYIYQSFISLISYLEMCYIRLED